MDPFVRHTGVVAPLDRADVDTDQIVPKQFLKRVERAGFGRHLFHDWRFDETGAPVPGFVLNRPAHAGASILVARRNFGCGSSREHAAWALRDFGFRAIIAPSFADIFRENADQNGLVTVEVDDEVADLVLGRAGALAPYTLTVDLAAYRIEDRAGTVATFAMDPFRRTCLMEGLDRIGLTLRHEADIAAFETAARRVSARP